MPASHVLHEHCEHGLAVLAFKVQPRQFDLNRDLKFISMKDQLIRGRTLVRAAQEAKLLSDYPVTDTNVANVIVIGGGIGGVSAALMACELGLSVKLVESNTECFSILNLGGDRLFSATVYDWPHAHSGHHEFPYITSLRDDQTAQALRNSGKTLRFPKNAVKSSTLRDEFIEQLKKYETEFGAQLDVLRGHRLQTMNDCFLNDAGAGVVAVRVKESASNVERWLTGQIVIFAAGFGLRKDSNQTEAAKDFFSYKDLEKDVATAVAVGGKGLVRIRGAGDGGLQEALRFVLDGKWHDLHECVSELERKLNKHGYGVYWHQLCGRLQSAEDQASRSLMWGYAESEIYRELHAIYRREIDSLLHAAKSVVVSWRTAVTRKSKFTVQLADKFPTSLKTYGLNRFLVGLLMTTPTSGEHQVELERMLIAGELEYKDVAEINCQYGEAHVDIPRMGFAAQEKPDQIGTAGKDDLLRRIAFQGIPMNLDSVA